MVKILVLGLGTVIIFGVSGFLIVENFQEITFFELLKRGRSLPVQVLIGFTYGSLSALLALFIINKKFFRKEKKYYHDKISSLELNNSGIVFISICAGVGEEIFFRAALQPFLGIWLTSILFVAIHGYLNPFNWVISVYGFFMTLVIAGFGYLMEFSGLITVIIAHTIFDMILLKKFTLIKPKDP
jgi:membrane protease YdiL (CAAX protease family)